MLEKEKEQQQWDTWLVEAVKKIRAQKQRPGLDRIYNAVRLIAEKEQHLEQAQKSPIAPIYNIQFNTIQVQQVQRHLERTVKAGLLFKVVSKGQTTYKTPDKCDRALNAECDEEVSKCLIKVLRELSEPDPSAATPPLLTPSSSKSSILDKKPGFTFDQLEEYIRHSHLITYPSIKTSQEYVEYLRSKLSEALAKEQRKGKVELVDEIYYKVTTSSSSDKSQLAKNAPSSSASHDVKRISPSPLGVEQVKQLVGDSVSDLLSRGGLGCSSVTLTLTLSTQTGASSTISSVGVGAPLSSLPTSTSSLKDKKDKDGNGNAVIKLMVPSLNVNNKHGTPLPVPRTTTTTDTTTRTVMVGGPLSISDIASAIVYEVRHIKNENQ